MSHHIYTTPGFVVNSRPHGEAGKFFLIFTRDLGMVSATAQGVRLIQSKLRYHTGNYSYNLFSLVRGKEVWRLTGVTELFHEKISDKDNIRLYIKILSLLRRLLPGEEKNEKLFEVIDRLYQLLSSKETDYKIDLLEYLIVLRMLHHLGYIRNKDVFLDLISNDDLDYDILKKVQKNKTLIIKEINSALKESQL